MGSAQCTTYDASFIAQPHSAMSSDSVLCAVDPASTGRSAESDTENSSSRPRSFKGLNIPNKLQVQGLAGSFICRPKRDTSGL